MKDFDTTPKPAFLRALQNNAWTISGALSELVDNSFGAGRGNAARVEITYDTKRHEVVVLDDGDGLDQLGRLFQLGNTVGRVPGDIGQYGSGGTMALLWLADRISIWTLRSGKVAHDFVNWKKQIAAEAYPQISNAWDRATTANTPRDLLALKHGTLIKIELQRTRRFSDNGASNAIRDLSIIYAPALRAGKEIIWKTIGRNGGERILTDQLPTLRNQRSLSGAVTMPDGSFLRFDGLVGLVENLPQSQSIISIGYVHRVIARTRDCFASPDGSEKFTGTGVCGFIDLGEDWQPYLATTKNGIDDPALWNALMAHIFVVLRPLLKELEKKRRNIVFEGLALMLRQALSGANDITVKIKEEQGEFPDLPTGPHIEHRAGHRTTTTETSGDKKAKQPALTEVLLEEATDEELDQCLCRIDEIGDGIMIQVNIDHPDVKAAVNAKPTNQEALAMLITSHIAEAAAADSRFRERLFRKHVLEQIESRHERPWSYMMRLLVDGMLRKAA